MNDPRRTVRQGYDRLGTRYRQWAAQVAGDPRDEMVTRFVQMLPPSARVLDMGCGAGLPSTALLAQDFEVTGIDASATQLRAARRNVPRAAFVQSDVMDPSLELGPFDGIVALYSISHIPRVEHGALFRRVYRWLVPGGLFLATLGATDSPDWTGDWLGVPMYFSAYDADTNRSLLRAAGFEPLVDEVRATDEPDGAVDFLWALVRRPLHE